MSTSGLDSRNIAISMRKSVENLVISSQDAIGQSISQALTFSGALTQHANQIIQDNKSVSRSPSPSLRTTDSSTDRDHLENDKSESIHVPSHPAGDAISVSSASDIAASPTSLRSDNAKSPNATARGPEGSGRTKKKTWYNALYPTYKNKSDDFKRLFKNLPDDERLIVDYSCALQKDILAHGRLYASQNYLCFYASIFGWETSMSLRWKDVTAITKEKTALVIPNAILVCTDGEKNFLTSFSGRDKAYLILFRIWQNALMDQPMTTQEYWQWVHTCYGEELGFGSDDEGYSRDFSLPTDIPLLQPVDNSECEIHHLDDTTRVNSLPVNMFSNIALHNHIKDQIDSSSMDAGGGASETRGDRDRSSRSASHARDRDASPPLVTNGDADHKPPEGDSHLHVPTDMSDSSDSEPEKHHNGGVMEKCTTAHSGKQLLQAQFPFNIDQLFTMIFTNSKFNLELLAARGTSDYVQAPWQAAGGLKCRQVSYVLGLTSGPIGPKEVHVTETQVMNKCSKPGVLYSIDATSENTGIPYADYFTVEAHYCLHRVAEHVTEFAIYGHVKYKKNMWPMVKAFLEKNTMSGLEEYARLIETRLAAEAEGAAPTARKSRRHRRAAASSQETTIAPVAKSPAAAILAPRASVSRAARSSSGGWLLGILLLLLAINGLLYWRLYHAQRPVLDMEDLQHRMSLVGSGERGDWSSLLERHATRQRGELQQWRHALATTIAHLHQTEQALKNLLESIEPSLEAARRNADDDPAPSATPATPLRGEL